MESLYKKLSMRYRRNRFHFFTEFMEGRAAPLRILDIGGTQAFWDAMGYPSQEGVDITILNVKEWRATRPGFEYVRGDARDLSRWPDRHFDVAFSNSVIEHVGGYRDQVLMAREMLRVGQRWFVQTPCRTFPFEPHFRLFFYHYLPVALRVWLLQHNIIRHGPHTYQRARLAVEDVHYLSRRMLQDLFPGGRIQRERALGLTKSWIVCSP